jgi:hypothetical protein
MGWRVKQGHFEQGRETAMTKEDYKLLFRGLSGYIFN